MPSKNERLMALENLTRVHGDILRMRGEAIEKLEALIGDVEVRLSGAANDHHALKRLRKSDVAALNERIDQVVEIIGARIDELESKAKDATRSAHKRIDGLVNDIAAATDSAKRAHERIDDLRELTGINRFTADAPFPTGGASTAEAAADAVLPVPQRGDRVRLEGARALNGRRVVDGWYDVIGHDGPNILGGPVFQIATRESAERDDTAPWLPWLAQSSHVKEVRHAGD
jgi:hypothetical protein